MSIYYSSEAGLCLLYGQLFLLTMFCLPENNEDWGQSESEGKAGREDPTWNYRGDTAESLKWKKCVPETSLDCAVLVRGGMWPLSRPIGTFWGGRAGGSLLRVSLLRLLPWTLASSTVSAATFVLCCQQAGSLPSTVLLLPALFPSLPDSLGCYRPGWRLRHHKTSLQPVSCPCPALLLQSWVNGMHGVYYWGFPCSQIPPFQMVRCAGQLKTFLHFPECGC